MNRGAGSYLQMVRPSVVNYLAVRKCFTGLQERYHYNLLSSTGHLAILNISLMCVHLRAYTAGFYYSKFSLRMRPHKSQTHNYVTTLAENGPAMAGSVLAPIHEWVVCSKSGSLILECFSNQASVAATTVAIHN